MTRPNNRVQQEEGDRKQDGLHWGYVGRLRPGVTTDAPEVRSHVWLTTKANKNRQKLHLWYVHDSRPDHTSVCGFCKEQDIVMQDKPLELCTYCRDALAI